MMHKAAFALLFSFLIFSASASASALFSNSSNASLLISNAKRVLQEVNQSAYLVFSPNLTSAYHYLSLAENASTIQLSSKFANLSITSALKQKSALDGYKQKSFAIMLVLTALFALLLYLCMKPIKSQKR